MASYGRRQLQWAAAQLAQGRPTVVFTHYPLAESVMNEAPGLRWPDLVSLLSAHTNVKLVGGCCAVCAQGLSSARLAEAHVGCCVGRSTRLRGPVSGWEADCKILQVACLCGMERVAAAGGRWPVAGGWLQLLSWPARRSLTTYLSRGFHGPFPPQAISGHLHKGYDWQGLYPFPHFTLPATRFDADNFLLLDLRSDGTYRHVCAHVCGYVCSMGNNFSFSHEHPAGAPSAVRGAYFRQQAQGRRQRGLRGALPGCLAS